VESVLRRSIGNQVALLEGGAPVARQTRRLLDAAGLLAPETATPVATATQFFTTGQVEDLRSATARWLQVDTSVSALAV
ncbi:MAG: glutamate racemase, partial [Rhodoferax sp.]